MKYLIDDQILILKLEGRLIMSNSDKTKNEMKKIIDEVVKESDIDYVAIDLQDVEFIDSTGVGVFISIYKFVVDKDLHLKLLQPQEIVKKVLTITKIGNIITIEE